MTPPAPVLDKSPAKSEQLFPYHLPLSPEWAEYNDWYSQTAMTSAAAGMFIKQPIIVWGALALAVFGYVNQQPLRQAKDASSPLLVLGMALAGIFGSVMPKTMLAAQTQSVPAA
ncbi:hypothetical protein I315_01580 [Cryptococcus gattii Ru294]|nr:hypothetical protein I315_01580 [Cryptococcus gattii Ru294]